MNNTSKLLENPYITYEPWGLDDGDDDGIYYQYFTEDMQSLFDKLAYTTGNWQCQARNINWRGSGGETVFHVEDFQEDLLHKIVPNSEWSARVYVEGRTITIVLSHHDCPTGSVYVFKPSRKSITD